MDTIIQFGQDNAAHRRPYSECECDMYSLTIPSFRQWTQREGYEHWQLHTMSAAKYDELWVDYIRYANKLRRGKVSQSAT